MCHRPRGFTLLELATVIAILAIVSTATMTGYSGYIHRAYAQQAVLHVHTLAGLLSGMPGGPVACAPSPPAVPRGKPADWVSSEGFRTLRFAPGDRTRFQYEVAVPGPDGAAFAVRARGDLDGDGEASLYELVADVPGLRVTEGLE